MSKISFTNAYTSYVYFRHGISQENLSGSLGKCLFYLLLPIDRLYHMLFGVSLERLMVGRTLSIDQALLDLVAQGGNCLIIELGCGFQERADRITRKYPNVRYIETDLDEVISKKLQHTPNITRQSCDITNIEDLRKLIHNNVAGFNRIIFVAEGVLVYFSPEQLAPLFTSMAEYQGAGSIVLLFETYHIHKGLFYFLAKLYQIILGRLTQSEMEVVDNHRRVTEYVHTDPHVKVMATNHVVIQKRVDLFVNTIGPR